MLAPEIALITLNDPSLRSAVADDMGIEIIHSHHAWADMAIASLQACKPAMKHAPMQPPCTACMR